MGCTPYKEFSFECFFYGTRGKLDTRSIIDRKNNYLLLFVLSMKTCRHYTIHDM